MPVQRTLTAIQEYVRSNPTSKRILEIPGGNQVYCAFVTNQHGPYFSTEDGLLKISVIEVFLDGMVNQLVRRVT